MEIILEIWNVSSKLSFFSYNLQVKNCLFVLLFLRWVPRFRDSFRKKYYSWLFSATCFHVLIFRSFYFQMILYETVNFIQIVGKVWRSQLLLVTNYLVLCRQIWTLSYQFLLLVTSHYTCLGNETNLATEISVIIHQTKRRSVLNSIKFTAYHIQLKKASDHTGQSVIIKKQQKWKE